MASWRGRLSVTNLSSENNLPTFRLNAPVIIRAKVKKCEQTMLFIAMHYWGYTSLEVKGREDCSSLRFHHSGPATRDFQSSISVEALLWGCHLDLQGLQCAGPPMLDHGRGQEYWGVVPNQYVTQQWCIQSTRSTVMGQQRESQKSMQVGTYIQQTVALPLLIKTLQMIFTVKVMTDSVYHMKSWLYTI